MKKKIGASLSSVEKSLLAAKVAGMVVRWIEEMFCDLFAVTLIGPCYSLAYIELFDVAKVLDEKGHISLHIYPAEFSDAYPPDLFRVRQQFLLSEDQGWWKELKGTESHYIKCYAAAGKLSDSDFTFPGLSKMFDPAHVDAAAVLDCFFSVLPDLLTELDNATKGLEASVDAWHSHHHLIRTYLEHSVVPSRLHDEATNETIIPSVVSLLNSSYTFYLEQMDKL